MMQLLGSSRPSIGSFDYWLIHSSKSRFRHSYINISLSVNMFPANWDRCKGDNSHVQTTLEELLIYMDRVIFVIFVSLQQRGCEQNNGVSPLSLSCRLVSAAQCERHLVVCWELHFLFISHSSHIWRFVVLWFGTFPSTNATMYTRKTQSLDNRFTTIHIIDDPHKNVKRTPNAAHSHAP